MNMKPTYDKLEQRVKELEKKVIVHDITEHKRCEEKLTENEARYRELFENISDAVMVFDVETLKFEDANKATLDLYGYAIEQFKTLTLLDILAEKNKTKDAVRKIVQNDLSVDRVPLRYQKKSNGEIFPTEISFRMYRSGGRKKIIVTVREITERRRLEEALLNTKKQLRKKAQTLEETNKALTLLLDHRAKEKIRFEKNILSNLQNLVMPYLKKMKKSKEKRDILDYLSIVERNLNEITSVFSTELTAKHIYLTQTEIQIANLIKMGKMSKEIALLLGVTPKTVFFHRENIRKKLKLTHRKINLKSYLQSIL